MYLTGFLKASHLRLAQWTVITIFLYPSRIVDPSLFVRQRVAATSGRYFVQGAPYVSGIIPVFVLRRFGRSIKFQLACDLRDPKSERSREKNGSKQRHHDIAVRLVTVLAEKFLAA